MALHIPSRKIGATAIASAMVMFVQAKATPDDHEGYHNQKGERRKFQNNDHLKKLGSAGRKFNHKGTMLSPDGQRFGMKAAGHCAALTGGAC